MAPDEITASAGKIRRSGADEWEPAATPRTAAGEYVMQGVGISSNQAKINRNLFGRW